MQSYRHLDWDTNFFGFKVATTQEEIDSVDKFMTLLGDARSAGVKLLYLPTIERINCLADDELEKLGVSLVDEKVTFMLDLADVEIEKSLVTPNVNIRPYNLSMSIKDLSSLAVQSGEQSRFSVDKKIPREKYEELYDKWIKNSLDKVLANEVLVLQEDSQIAGMVTLGEKKGRGDIGLLAVDKKFRGKKYGEALLRSAHVWFLNNGYKNTQVVTQGNNLAACGLYKKCGYKVEKTEYFHHVWL